MRHVNRATLHVSSIRMTDEPLHSKCAASDVMSIAHVYILIRCSLHKHHELERMMPPPPLVYRGQQPYADPDGHTDIEGLVQNAGFSPWYCTSSAFCTEPVRRQEEAPPPARAWYTRLWHRARDRLGGYAQQAEIAESASRRWRHCRTLLPGDHSDTILFRHANACRL